ncbi:succinylglutamate desuccinylase/aspartoacylase family protein [Pseudomonas sp. MH10]|uniref:succinylglutamate desuccinylase/aspartoacylase family protein n=2 Tax=unclassified Pseudomonas TaxID=196821 RepID=UPI002AC8BE21|nr:succinylglutamate desuccinylase/aspartoacylase family protein [Pseudomonas sp. MH10]MEB0042578.1 succinylglutamate desuccinylase/aspartoacylase family protein [Pseudomonas sp. MH10]WPX64513.1 succinylglutamate desuccinylase/aspartoacylase family protein [Pseudomonas sp. MH10]
MNNNNQASLIACTVDFSQEGFQKGALMLPYSQDRSAYGRIPIPVVVLKKGVGPTVLLTGGNHGDELEGPIALMKLIQRMSSLEINGRLIVIPGLNFPAFENGTRTSPIDKGNLNRLFPGNRSGSLTEMIAHYVNTELFPISDVILDLHAGGASFQHAPALLASLPANREQHDDYLRLVYAFAAPTTMVMNLLGEDRTYGAAAERQGKLFLCGEFGGGASCSPGNLKIVEDGLHRVLHSLGVLNEVPPTPVQKTRLVKVEDSGHYLFASARGVFEPCFSLGDRVTKGQLAGRLFDIDAPWKPAEELHFAKEGEVMVQRTFAHVAAGDCIAVLACPATWQ